MPAFIREIERLEAAEVTEEELRSVLSSLQTAADSPGSAALRVREPNRARFTRLDRRSDMAVTGRRIRSADYPLDPRRLVVGTVGVSLVQGDKASTVRFADCAALLTWPDGGRRIIGRDGVTIRIEPTLWRMKKLLTQVDAMVPAGRLVVLPARAAQEVPRPWTRRRTRVAARMLVNPAAAALVGVVAVLALLILLTKLVPGSGIIAGAIVFPALIIGAAAGRHARVRLLRRAASQGG